MSYADDINSAESQYYPAASRTRFKVGQIVRADGEDAIIEADRGDFIDVRVQRGVSTRTITVFWNKVEVPA